MSKKWKLQRMVIYKNSLIARLTSLSIRLIPEKEQNYLLWNSSSSQRSLTSYSQSLLLHVQHSHRFFVGFQKTFLKRLKCFPCLTRFFIRFLCTSNTPESLSPLCLLSADLFLTFCTLHISKGSVGNRC